MPDYITPNGRVINKKLIRNDVEGSSRCLGALYRNLLGVTQETTKPLDGRYLGPSRTQVRSLTAETPYSVYYTKIMLGYEDLSSKLACH
jgi:hypothetical protein